MYAAELEGLKKIAITGGLTNHLSQSISVSKPMSCSTSSLSHRHRTSPSASFHDLDDDVGSDFPFQRDNCHTGSTLAPNLIMSI